MLKNLFLALTLFVIYSHAEILEIYDMDEVRAFATQQEDLVLFDVDDTLITNSVTLGSPAWRSWAKSKVNVTHPDFVVYDALTLFSAKKVPYRAVEPATVTLISDLQAQGITTFAFTARGRSEWYTTTIEGVDKFTHQQLNGAGIDFNLTSIPEGLQNLDPSYFQNGIIFAQHIKKGELLSQLLEDLDYHPTSIIFVDDKLDQVQSVEAALKDTGIPFKGFWYRKIETLSKNFNPQVANVQLENLLVRDQILSDEEAIDYLTLVSQINPVDYFHLILNHYDLSKLTPQLD